MSDERCPQCGGTVLGVEIRGVYDGVLYWACPNAHRWQRWPEGGPLHEAAKPYIAGELPDGLPAPETGDD